MKPSASAHHRHAGCGAKPSGERISDKPAGVRERELRREQGRAGLRDGPTAQKAASRRLRRRIGCAEQGPGRKQAGPGAWACGSRPATGRKRSAGATSPPRQAASPPGRRPVEDMRQERAPPPLSLRRTPRAPWRHRCRQAEHAAHQHHRVDDHHGAGRRHRQVQSQQAAQPRRRKIDASALRGGASQVRRGCRRMRAAASRKDHERRGAKKADDRSAEQPVKAGPARTAGRRATG